MCENGLVTEANRWLKNKGIHNIIIKKVDYKGHGPWFEFDLINCDKSEFDLISDELLNHLKEWNKCS